ncbi:MAG: hypothetical protein DRP27_07275 [Thermotogae bacterium]|nr:MAG: hypothetical protein DRP27_07275 [Thermotogota bacterium]
MPEELHTSISAISRNERIAAWKVIARAITFYETARREKFREVSDFSKLVWYVYKFSASVGELRGSPTEENLRLLIRTCQQLTKRLGVDTSRVVLAAEQYVKRPTRKGRMVLNDCAKEVVGQIILRFGEGR